ncbi:MAG TPA: hypothetical protein P5550_06415 [Bacteroidales bacterium]|nr:hypothetical protein [Bacteroidales bacterium]HRZ78209.1 hypothetical protein [Bacteroidales bacterium]
MIKKVLFFAMLTLLFAACNTTGKGEGEAMTVGQFLEEAENLVDQTISIEGTVTHVCKHGGKRLFIKDAEDNEIKVESGESIAQFDATLEGTDIIVEAIVKELRIDEAYLQEWEAELAAEAAEAAADTVEVTDPEAAAEPVEAEEPTEEVPAEEHPEMPGKDDHHSDPYVKIQKYREEIAASGKGYISQYWLEAVSYKEKVAEGEAVATEEKPAK